MLQHNPHYSSGRSSKGITKSREYLSDASGYNSDTHQLLTNYSEDLGQKDQQSYKRDLNAVNMKLSEEIIKQRLQQTSSIEKMSNDRSRLFLMLNEQKLESKRLMEQNQVLLMKAKSQERHSLCSRSRSPQLHQETESPNAMVHSELISPQDRLGYKSNNNRNGLGRRNDSSPSFTPQQLRFPSPISRNDQSSFTEGYSQNLKTSPHIRCRDFSVIGTNRVGEVGFEEGRLSDVTLLQNHIILLEKENELLKRELALAKQQDSHTALNYKELDIEIRDLTNTKASLMKQNEELREFLRERTEEANRTITTLTQLNQDLNTKVQNYQLAVDALTKELFNFTKQGETSQGKGTHKQQGTPGLATNNSAEQPKPLGVIDPNRDEILLCRQENFKLKADLKVLSELIDTVRKENDALLQERSNNSANKLKISPWESQRSSFSSNVQSVRNLKSTPKISSQISSQAFHIFKSPETTTRDIINGHLMRAGGSITKL